MKYYQDMLDSLRETIVDREVHIIADIRSRFIIPLCNRKRLEFVGGMGTWVFFAEKGEGQWGCGMYSDNYKMLGKRIQGLLSLESVLSPGQSIGSLMENYTPPDWSRT